MPYMDGKGQVSPVLRFFWCTATGTRKVSRWMSCSPLGQTAWDFNGRNQGHFYWTKHFHERISQFVSTCIWAYVFNFILYTLKGLDKIFAFVTCWHSTGSRVNETNFGAVDAPASWYMTWAIWQLWRFFSSTAGADPVIYSMHFLMLFISFRNISSHMSSKIHHPHIIVVSPTQKPLKTYIHIFQSRTCLHIHMLFSCIICINLYMNWYWVCISSISISPSFKSRLRPGLSLQSTRMWLIKSRCLAIMIAPGVVVTISRYPLTRLQKTMDHCRESVCG